MPVRSAYPNDDGPGIRVVAVKRCSALPDPHIILLTDHGVRCKQAPERGTTQAGVNAPVGARAILPSEPVN
jgi:hypothetical protein